MPYDEYQTISGISETNLIVKKSRFIGLSASVSSIREINDFLDYARTEYPKASHYCYAYSIGLDDKKREYSADAGEPTNSAGPPILTAISSSGLNNLICVVIRYFGGIKLGIGGLIRAYGKCARECLKSASIETRIFYQTFCIRTPYQHLGSVLNLLNKLRARIVDVASDEEEAKVMLQIRQSMIDKLREGLKQFGNYENVGIITDFHTFLLPK
ncbi:MAG: IMPACT family protein [Candidatus Poribacteria bacterium]